MPFLRISRDRRGYEYFCLTHLFSTPRGTRPRTLYLFRSPPNLKVGRAPIDEDAKRALEARYPDLSFDWDALRNTPMPPPSPEHWRERRRADRAMREFHAASEAEVSVDEVTLVESVQPVGAVAPMVDVEPDERSTLRELSGAEPLELRQTGVSEAVARSEQAGVPPSRETPELDGRRRRRRRRGRRGKVGAGASSGQPLVEPAVKADSSSTHQHPDQAFPGEPRRQHEDG